MDGWAPGPNSGRSGGRPDGLSAGRAEGNGTGCLAEPGSSRAVRCASLGGSGRADGLASGPGSGQSAGRPDGPTVGHQGATGRMPGRGRAAPARCAASPWASLAGWIGGTWSRLQAVRRTARQADSGPPEGHRPDAGQGPDGSRAARCGSLGGSGRVDGRAPGHSSGQSWRTARQAESGPGSSGAVRCGSLGAALGLPMCPARTQSAPRTVLQISPRRRIWGGSWRCAVS